MIVAGERLSGKLNLESFEKSDRGHQRRLLMHPTRCTFVVDLDEFVPGLSGEVRALHGCNGYGVCFTFDNR